MGQWLGLHPSTAGGLGLISDWGPRSHKLIAVVKKKKKKRTERIHHKYTNKIPLLLLNMQNIFNFMMISNLVMNIFVPKYFSKFFHHGAFPHDRE